MRVGDNRFVAFFDMLGMSSLTVRDPELAFNAVHNLCRQRMRRLSLKIQLPSASKLIENRIRHFVFSDTVVAFTESDTLDDLRAVVMLGIELFAGALSECIPLRGGIAHGRFIFSLDEGLFVGPALVSAYRLGERAQWLGIVVDDSIAQRARDIPEEKVPLRAGPEEPLIEQWQLPVQGGIESANVVNWPAAHRQTFKIPPPITVAQFYSGFRKLFGDFADLPESVQAKYLNTVAYINAKLRPE